MDNNFDYSDYQTSENDKKVLYDDNLIKKENNNNFFNNPDNSSKKNLIISICLIVVVIGLIIGFIVFKMNDKEKEEGEVNKEPDTSLKEEEEEETEKEVSIINVNSKTRPYAVMINCHNGALPQAGLQNAYIVYELMVEGGITRMMALFKDKDVSKIGSIRSARTQYLDYVYEHDAIYVHAGGAPDATERIKNEKISDIDVDGAYGVRDKTLNRSWEHTLFTTTNLLNKGSKDKGFKTETETKNVLTYQGNPLDLTTYKNTKTANNVSIKYSDYRTSNYIYDSKKQVYLRSMNNTKNIDLVTGNQYEVKNIIVYGVKHTTYKYGGNSKYQKLDNVGKGDGYYITNGKAIPITWEKTSKNTRTIYKVKETGKELVLNDGNTYIQIYPTSGNLTIN
ncbi:MAG: DUF3048 domain-containing protein [Bacilli bacterium]|nr:DUF3048 domain-containing protein [Bacilli bacterium]